MPKKSSTPPLSVEDQIRLHLAMKGQNPPESEFMDDSLPELNSEPFFCKIAEMISLTDSNIMMFCMTYGVCNTVREADGSYASLMSVLCDKDAPEGRRAEFVFYRYTDNANMERFTRFYDELTEENFEDIDAILTIYTDVTMQILRNGPDCSPVVTMDGIPIYGCMEAAEHMSCIYIGEIEDLYEAFHEDKDCEDMFSGGTRLEFGSLYGMIMNPVSHLPQIYVFEYLVRAEKAPDEREGADDRYEYRLAGCPYNERNKRMRSCTEFSLDELPLGILADLAECLEYTYDDIFSENEEEDDYDMELQ